MSVMRLILPGTARARRPTSPFPVLRRRRTEPVRAWGTASVARSRPARVRSSRGRPSAPARASSGTRCARSWRGGSPRRPRPCPSAGRRRSGPARRSVHRQPGPASGFPGMPDDDGTLEHEVEGVPRISQVHDLGARRDALDRGQASDRADVLLDSPGKRAGPSARTWTQSSRDGAIPVGVAMVPTVSLRPPRAPPVRGQCVSVRVHGLAARSRPARVRASARETLGSSSSIFRNERRPILATSRSSPASTVAVRGESSSSASSPKKSPIPSVMGRLRGGARWPCRRGRGRTSPRVAGPHDLGELVDALHLRQLDDGPQVPLRQAREQRDLGEDARPVVDRGFGGAADGRHGSEARPRPPRIDCFADLPAPAGSSWWRSGPATRSA